jgi:uncharacterized protein (TIGR03435 family)
MKRIRSLLPLALAVSAAIAQQPRFEAASIKPAAPSPGGLRFGGDPGRIHYTRVTLRELIAHAWQLRNDQVEGPESLDAQQFDIDATLPHGAPDTQIPAMLQTLVEERFHLQNHWVDKSVNGYILRQRSARAASTVLKQSTAPGRGGVAFMGDKLQAVNANMDALCGLLTSLLGAPVLNETDLTERYDFQVALDLQNLAPPETTPSILAAMKDLGLSLESRKLPMKHLIVDALDRAPTPN